jgi:thiosulfate/3-mercaptopyruvate sulfurtransferase
MFSSIASYFRCVFAAFALLAAFAAGPARAQDPAPNFTPIPAAGAITPLVSVDWLKAHLSDPVLIVLDVRSAIDGSTPETYAKGHIPGALASDYDKSGWRATRNGIPFMLPSVAQLEKLIGELGIDEDSRVIVVPAGVSATDFGSATRVYWTLKVVGVKKVSILDGGYAAWVAAGAEVQTGVNTPSPTIFESKIDSSLIADAADVEDMLKTHKGTLVDARPAPFFTGKTKVDIAGAYGHIPSAINIDSAEFYDENTNRLKPLPELKKIAAQIPGGGPVISYCNTGHWSSTDWFVLAELLGRKDVKVYYGSMVDWTFVPTRPVTSSRTKWDDIKKFFGHGS